MLPYSLVVNVAIRPTVQAANMNRGKLGSRQFWEDFGLFTADGAANAFLDVSTKLRFQRRGLNGMVSYKIAKKDVVLTYREALSKDIVVNKPTLWKSFLLNFAQKNIEFVKSSALVWLPRFFITKQKDFTKGFIEPTLISYGTNMLSASMVAPLSYKANTVKSNTSSKRWKWGGGAIKAGIGGVMPFIQSLIF